MAQITNQAFEYVKSDLPTQAEVCESCVTHMICSAMCNSADDIYYYSRLFPCTRRGWHWRRVIRQYLKGKEA